MQHCDKDSSEYRAFGQLVVQDKERVLRRVPAEQARIGRGLVALQANSACMYARFERE